MKTPLYMDLFFGTVVQSTQLPVRPCTYTEYDADMMDVLLPIHAITLLFGHHTYLRGVQALCLCSPSSVQVLYKYTPSLPPKPQRHDPSVA